MLIAITDYSTYPEPLLAVEYFTYWIEIEVSQRGILHRMKFRREPGRHLLYVRLVAPKVEASLERSAEYASFLGVASST